MSTEQDAPPAVKVVTLEEIVEDLVGTFMEEEFSYGNITSLLKEGSEGYNTLNPLYLVNLYNLENKFFNPEVKNSHGRTQVALVVGDNMREIAKVFQEEGEIEICNSNIKFNE